MGKKRRKSAQRTVASTGANDYKSKLVKVACIGAGIALGKIVKDKLAPAASSVTGIDGVTSEQVTAAVIAAAGVAGSVMLKNGYVKDVALGMGVAGTAAVVNSLTGKSLVALGEVAEEPIMIPQTSEYVETPVEGVEDVDPVFAGIGGSEDMILS